MELSCEILGAPVAARGSGDDVIIEVGDHSFTPADIEALSASRADWSGTTIVGEYVLTPTAIDALKAVAAAACAAAAAESSACPR